jgi:hypothetical protein
MQLKIQNNFTDDYISCKEYYLFLNNFVKCFGSIIQIYFNSSKIW